MKLEDLVCPLWFAKKLPKEMDTVYIWFILGGYAFLSRIEDVEQSLNEFDNYYPAPTMQEMLPLIEDRVIEFVRVTKQEYLTHAFVTELKKEGEGWKYLDSLLFPKG